MTSSSPVCAGIVTSCVSVIMTVFTTLRLWGRAARASSTVGSAGRVLASGQIRAAVSSLRRVALLRGVPSCWGLSARVIS